MNRSKYQCRMCGQYRQEYERTDEEQVNYILNQANSRIQQYIREKRGAKSHNGFSSGLIYATKLGYEVDNVNFPD